MKHKKQRRFLAIVLCVAMVLTYMPMAAFAEGEGGGALPDYVIGALDDFEKKPAGSEIPYATKTTAESTDVYTLNYDLTVAPEGLTINSNTRIDLNGHILSSVARGESTPGSQGSSKLFDVAAGTLTLVNTGSGSEGKDYYYTTFASDEDDYCLTPEETEDAVYGVGPGTILTPAGAGEEAMITIAKDASLNVTGVTFQALSESVESNFLNSGENPETLFVNAGTLTLENVKANGYSRSLAKNGTAGVFTKGNLITNTGVVTIENSTLSASGCSLIGNGVAQQSSQDILEAISKVFSDLMKEVEGDGYYYGSTLYSPAPAILNNGQMTISGSTLSAATVVNEKGKTLTLSDSEFYNMDSSLGESDVLSDMMAPRILNRGEIKVAGQTRIGDPIAQLIGGIRMADGAKLTVTEALPGRTGSYSALPSIVLDVTDGADKASVVYADGVTKHGNDFGISVLGKVNDTGLVPKGDGYVLRGNAYGKGEEQIDLTPISVKLKDIVLNSESATGAIDLNISGLKSEDMACVNEYFRLLRDFLEGKNMEGDAYFQKAYAIPFELLQTFIGGGLLDSTYEKEVLKAAFGDVKTIPDVIKVLLQAVLIEIRMMNIYDGTDLECDVFTTAGAAGNPYDKTIGYESVPSSLSGKNITMKQMFFGNSQSRIFSNYIVLKALAKGTPVTRYIKYGSSKYTIPGINELLSSAAAVTTAAGEGLNVYRKTIKEATEEPQAPAEYRYYLGCETDKYGTQDGVFQYAYKLCKLTDDYYTVKDQAEENSDHPLWKIVRNEKESDWDGCLPFDEVKPLIDAFNAGNYVAEVSDAVVYEYKEGTGPVQVDADSETEGTQEQKISVSKGEGETAWPETLPEELQFSQTTFTADEDTQEYYTNVLNSLEADSEVLYAGLSALLKSIVTIDCEGDDVALKLLKGAAGNEKDSLLSLASEKKEDGSYSLRLYLDMDTAVKSVLGCVEKIYKDLLGATAEGGEDTVADVLNAYLVPFLHYIGNSEYDGYEVPENLEGAFDLLEDICEWNGGEIDGMDIKELKKLRRYLLESDYTTAELFKGLDSDDALEGIKDILRFAPVTYVNTNPVEDDPSVEIGTDYAHSFDQLLHIQGRYELTIMDMPLGAFVGKAVDELEKSKKEGESVYFMGYTLGDFSLGHIDVLPCRTGIEPAVKVDEPMENHKVKVRIVGDPALGYENGMKASLTYWPVDGFSDPVTVTDINVTTGKKQVLIDQTDSTVTYNCIYQVAYDGKTYTSRTASFIVPGFGTQKLTIKLPEGAAEGSAALKKGSVSIAEGELTEGSISLENLPYGTYNLAVAAKNSGSPETTIEQTYLCIVAKDGVTIDDTPVNETTGFTPAIDFASPKSAALNVTGTQGIKEGETNSGKVPYYCYYYDDDGNFHFTYDAKDLNAANVLVTGLNGAVENKNVTLKIQKINNSKIVDTLKKALKDKSETMPEELKGHEFAALSIDMIDNDAEEGSNEISEFEAVTVAVPFENTRKNVQVYCDTNASGTMEPVEFAFNLDASQVEMNVTKSGAYFIVFDDSDPTTSFLAAQADKTQAFEGDFVEVAVSVKGGSFVGAEYSLAYDKANYELVGIKPCGADDFAEMSDSTGTVTASPVYAGKDQGALPSGTVLGTVKFKVKGQSENQTFGGVETVFDVSGTIAATRNQVTSGDAPAAANVDARVKVAPSYYIETVADYVAGRSLVLVYTNAEDESFTFNGKEMFPMLGSKYTFGGNATTNTETGDTTGAIAKIFANGDLITDAKAPSAENLHVFGYVADFETLFPKGTNGNAIYGLRSLTMGESLSEDEAKAAAAKAIAAVIKAISAENRTCSELLFGGNQNYNVNSSAKIDLYDAVASQGVFNGFEEYFKDDAQMGIILKADASQNKLVNIFDINDIVHNYGNAVRPQ